MARRVGAGAASGGGAGGGGASCAMGWTGAEGGGGCAWEQAAPVNTVAKRMQVDFMFTLDSGGDSNACAPRCQAVEQERCHFGPTGGRDPLPLSERVDRSSTGMSENSAAFRAIRRGNTAVQTHPGPARSV